MRTCARLGVLALALWPFAPSAGRAWTKAHVREAHAALSLSGAERVAVELELVLEVHGGWLEQLELPGLDEGLVLAELEPAVAILESGEEVPAEVSLHASTLVLRFARRDGLRRGVHRLRVRYALPRAALLQPNVEQPLRFYWTLPGFEAGLTRATVSLLGPHAMHAVEAGELAQAIDQVARGREQLLTFRRVHVPRATPWTVAVELPAAYGFGALTSAPAGRRAESGVGDWATSGLLVLASLALVALMRKWVERSLWADGLGARGLLLTRPLSPIALGLLSLAAALSFAHVPAISLLAWCAMFAFGVPQAARVRGPLALGTFRPLTRDELRAFSRARLLARLGVPWADAHSLLGSFGGLALVSLPALQGGLAALRHGPWGMLALCALFGILASARGLRPRSLAEQVGLLVRAARSARTVGCALRLVGYDSKGRLSQPRLRLEPGVRYPGLLRLEVLVDTRRSARPLVLSALVEGDSAAERWLCALWPSAYRERAEGGQRRALLVPIDDVGKASEAIFEHFSRESQRLLFASADAAHAA